MFKTRKRKILFAQAIIFPSILWIILPHEALIDKRPLNFDCAEMSFLSFIRENELITPSKIPENGILK
jgi:hypothetical protein